MRGMARGAARMREARRKTRKEEMKKRADLSCSLPGLNLGVLGLLGDGVAAGDATLKVGRDVVWGSCQLL